MIFFYSAVDKFDELAPRIGFWHDFKKHEFLVKKWDTKEEDISSECKKRDLFIILHLAL